MKIMPIPDIDNKLMYSKVLHGKHNVCTGKLNCEKYKQDPNNCKMIECRKCLKSPRYILLKYEKEVTQQYDDYKKNAPDFEKMDSTIHFGDDIKNELKTAYKNSQIFGKVKKGLLNNYKNKGRCPFCMISEPKTLDHYLSESEYPQFILYAPNLVPCCNNCNTIKNTSLMTDEHKRIYFHYYYDEIPDEEILECSIDSFKEKKFSFSVDETKKCKNADLYRRQYKALMLEDRYQDACVGQLSIMLDMLEKYYVKNGNSFEKCIEILKIALESNKNILGVNHYKTALYKGVLNNSLQLAEFLKAQ